MLKKIILAVSHNLENFPNIYFLIFSKVIQIQN